MLRAAGTGWIGHRIAAWTVVILRYRRLAIAAGLAGAAFCFFFASQNLGINTDTADMISADLAWRQDFIAYRERFSIRDRNILIVVDAGGPEQADQVSTAIANGLRASPELYENVYLAGEGEFFERNGLLYASVADLDELALRLTEARPLLAGLQQRFDGVRLLQILPVIAARDEIGPGSAALIAQVAAVLDSAVAGDSRALSWRGLLFDESEAGARRVIMLQPRLDFTRARPAAEAMAGIQALLEGLPTVRSSATRVRVTGTIAMEHEELSSVIQGASLAGLMALVVVTLVLYVALRSFLLLAVAVVTLIAGLAATAAFAALAVGHLNLLSVAFAVLYIGLGVDFILHVSLRLRELRHRGTDLDAAIVETMQGVGTSLVICSVTTAAGFFSFIPTPFSGVSELGLISGSGMFISLIFSLTLLPALLGQFYRSIPPPRETSSRGVETLDAIARRPRQVVGAAIVVSICAAFLLPRASFDRNPVNLRDPNSESVVTLQDLAASGEASPLFMVALAENAAVAQQWANELEALSSVEDVRSLDDLVPAEQQRKLLVLGSIAENLGAETSGLEFTAGDPIALRNAFSELNSRLPANTAPETEELRQSVERLLETLAAQSDEAQRSLLLEVESNLLATLPRQLQLLAAAVSAEPFGREDLPPELVTRWIADDGTELIEISPSSDISDAANAEAFVSSVRSTTGSATGLPVVHQESGRTVVRAFQLAFSYALIMVGILLWVFLRRISDSLLVLVPVVLAAGLTAALTVIFGLQFNFANIIALPLLLGVGVDNGIHIVHRMRTDPTSHDEFLTTSTSRAILASGLTTIASFGNLAFASHLGLASMGQLLSLGMVVTVLATLVVIPAMFSLRQTV